jgi:hypothetical protein
VIRAGCWGAFSLATLLLRGYAMNISEEEQALNHLQEAVVHNADWVNRVLVSGTSIAGVVVLLKILGHSEFEWQDVKISVQGAWMVFALFSVAHGYVAWLLVRLYLMDPGDPSTWLAHGAVILMASATIPFKLEAATAIFAFVSVVLSFVNWQIGSHWVIALSELTVPNVKAYYHLGLARQRRVRWARSSPP